MGEERKVYRVLMGKPRRPWHRWEVGIRMGVRVIG
jgi:hypothetical protein